MPAKGAHTARPHARMRQLDPVSPRHQQRGGKSGLDAALAVAEGNTLPRLPHPTCVEGCPVELCHPRFHKADTARALRPCRRCAKAHQRSAGRVPVCPGEAVRAAALYHEDEEGPVAMRLPQALHRRQRDSPRRHGPIWPSPTSIRVAVAGSGPAGLSFAGAMPRKWALRSMSSRLFTRWAAC